MNKAHIRLANSLKKGKKVRQLCDLRGKVNIFADTKFYTV